MSMSAIERVIPLVGHLPPSIREALSRRLRELTGFGLVTLSGVASAALMTWSVQDPSLSHATSRPIRNILGYAGAIGADLAMHREGPLDLEHQFEGIDRVQPEAGPEQGRRAVDVVGGDGQLEGAHDRGLDVATKISHECLTRARRRRRSPAR